MNYNEVMDYIKDTFEFETVKELAVDNIVTDRKLRECCDQNLCGKFNKTWSCPPAIQTFDECNDLLRRYSTGILIHKSYEIEDEYDYESMFEFAKVFAEEFLVMYLDVVKKYPTIFALSAGGCTICEKCTYPKEPCRFPEKMLSSLESFGIYVLDLAKKCDVKYRKSPNHIDYYGMVFV